MVAIVGAAISALLLLSVFLTVSCRVANPTGFRKVLLSDTSAYVVRADAGGYGKGIQDDAL